MRRRRMIREMAEPKYEFTGKKITVAGHVLRRIRCLKDLGDVKPGDVGGWIENRNNLSDSGDCWIYDNAKVYGSAQVTDDAEIYDDAQVYGYAKVSGHASVCGRAEVFDAAKVYNYALVADDAKVYGNAQVNGEQEIGGNEEIGGQHAKNWMRLTEGEESGRYEIVGLEDYSIDSDSGYFTFSFRDKVENDWVPFDVQVNVDDLDWQPEVPEDPDEYPNSWYLDDYSVSVEFLYEGEEIDEDELKERCGLTDEEVENLKLEAGDSVSTLGIWKDDRGRVHVETSDA